MEVRITQEKRLAKVIKINRSSFIAITGRRRVGKTYLIDNYLKNYMCFRLTGIQDASTREQLRNFNDKLSYHSKMPMYSESTNWQGAFLQLKTYLKTLDKRSKKVIFLDELPWMVKKRSGFLQMLAHLWNDYLSKEKHFILIVCGSSTSWLTKKIINDKGGLHNRLTDIIHLKPFTLKESNIFLRGLNIKLTLNELTKVYMAMGGIPYYLEQIEKGESAAQAIERLCFSDNGILKNEYDNLYKALFNNAHLHEKVIEILSKSKAAIPRKILIEKSKIKAGGSFNRVIEELIQTGFVEELTPFGKSKRGIQYRINDEYSVFYHRFIRPNKKYVPGMWQQLSSSQTYKIWAGYAFESLCHKHINNIKKALGISSVYTEYSSFSVVKNGVNKGFQIDLVIDRKDGVINLCEIKFYAAPFTIDKKYARELLIRKQLFIDKTNTRKQVFTTFISNYGIVDNEYFREVVDKNIILDELIK